MLSKKKKLSFRFLSLLLSASLVFNPLLAPAAWASEEDGLEPPPEETTTQSSEPEPTPSPAEETGEGDSSVILTGDAESEAAAETTVNTNVNCLPGEVSDPEDPCDLPDVEGEGCVNEENEADIDTDADSSATTGVNEISGTEGDALIGTGDATASADLETAANLNLTLLENEGSQGEGESDPSSAVIQIENEAEVENEADSTADTGENQISDAGGDAAILTGNALALANLLNLLNLNVVGSEFEIFLFDHFLNLEGDVNLNEVWAAIQAQDGVTLNLNSEVLDLFLIQNENQAELINNVEVTADTGENQISDTTGNAAILTGNATALANVVNFVNINILGSKFLLAIINIGSDFTGNLILPRPENFLNQAGSSEDGSSLIINNDNQALINNEVASSANTGDNSTQGNQSSSLIATGDATALANSLTVANLNLLLNYWFFFNVVHLGSWNGQILGWSNPGAQEDPNAEASTTFQLQPESEVNGSCQGDCSSAFFRNQNQASIQNNINVFANTGQNQISDTTGNAAILTGHARALANLFNLVNLNLVGSRWFLGLVNVLGDWQGNLVFAYPDVAVSLTNGHGQVTPGETTSYTLHFENQGYDQAENVKVEFELPEGVNYLGDTSGLTPLVSGRTYSWLVGSLGVGEGGRFTIQVQIDPGFQPTEKLSFWSNLKAKIIPPVHAAEGESGGEIVAVALIGTSDPESDLNNNSASATTLVYFPSQDQESAPDHRLPELTITAKNNVAEFVYPGDTVTFEITVTNSSEVPAYDSYLYQQLFNGLPDEDFGSAGFKLGTVNPGQTLTLRFGLKLAPDVLGAGFYHTEAMAFAKAPNGTEVASNQARTDFEIRLQQLQSLFEAQAVEEENKVLGLVAAGTCPNREDVLPYLLSLLVSSLWLAEKSRRQLLLVKNPEK